ncbi:MAG: tRNA preQ1(34) S-adenosylmethionine ribosyltransferase-isomerase QueA [Acidobacteriota bacterium]
MDIREFDFELPDELIAQEPVEPRDHSRLMVVDRSSGSITHHRFFELPELLPPRSLLVLNDTRVFPARLIGRTDTGARVEILLLRGTEDALLWEALARPARRCRPGRRIIVSDELRLTVQERATEAGKVTVRFDPVADLWACLEKHGHVPLPPYIRRPDRPTDRVRYQTVFARERGSVAAPTAGLHFTQELLARLDHCTITLHVGYGTFQPIRVRRVEEHRMEAEFFEIQPGTAERLNRHRQSGGGLVAVGTTTTRALESAADPEGRIVPQVAWTELFIYPGYRFRAVDHLITNFHLPGSTLILLVAAFAGTDLIREAYRVAIAERYRFYSYGDAMLVV